MTKIIIGCDPDSTASGFASYHNGKLLTLRCLPLLDFYFYLDDFCMRFEPEEIELHIEDVNGNRSSAFNHRSRQAKQVQNKISESVGRCKQVQIEVEKVAEHFGIKIVRHPVSSKWKDKAGKKEFEAVTGWAGASNEDNRSAAYFGYLGVIANKHK